MSDRNHKNFEMENGQNYAKNFPMQVSEEDFKWPQMSWNLMSNYMFNQPTDPQNQSTPITERKRRGRKPLLPKKEREINRRLKKRDVERKRRAYMLDRMNALQNLTLSIMGHNSHEHPKLEKAELLNLCHSLMQSVANVMKEKPDLALTIRSEIARQSSLPSLTNGSYSVENEHVNYSPNDDLLTTDEGIVDPEISHDEDKENRKPSNCIVRSAFQRYQSRVSPEPHTGDSFMTTSLDNSANSSSVWRPYL